MEPVSVSEWFWTLLIFAIPIVNIIVFICYVLGTGKPSIVNFCRASCLWFLVGLALSLLFGLLGT